MNRVADVQPLRVLFVCLGNICRSPTAEGLMRAKVREAGLQERIALDSAGTGSWHVGERPDPRAAQAARARGIELDSLARQVGAEDFDEFDLIVAMDGANLRVLERLAPDRRARGKLRLLREFELPPPHAEDGAGARARGAERHLDVPDPYYGGSEGFERVLNILEAGCDGLLEQIRRGFAAENRERASARASGPPSAREAQG
jgi:protein-tyrosine phosphatase